MAFNRNKSLAKAQKSLQKGKIADAIKDFQEVVDNDPSDVRTLLKIGDLHAKLGNIEGANETYRKVAEHYAKDGFFLKAVAVFKQILKLDPGLIHIYLRLAELYVQLGLNSEAMKQYQTVVRHYESQGLKKESLDILKRMAELEPDNVASRVKLAELYAREGHEKDARDQFAAVTTDLKNKNNFQDLARVLEKMEGLKLGDANLTFELVNVYLKTAEPKRALERIQEVFKKEPKNPQVLEILAKTFVELQLPEKAKSVYKELVAILTEKGQIEQRDQIQAKLRGLGDVSPAAPAVPGVPKVSAPVEAPAAAEPPPSPEVSKKMLSEASVLVQYGLVEKACELLGRIVLSDPGNDEARGMLIQSFSTKGDPVGLVDLLTKAASAAQSRGLSKAVVSIKAQIAAAGGGDAHSTQVISEAEIDESQFTVGSGDIADATVDLSLDDSIDLEIVDDEAPTSQQVASETQSLPTESAGTGVDLTGDFERGENAEISAGPESNDSFDLATDDLSIDLEVNEAVDLNLESPAEILDEPLEVEKTSAVPNVEKTIFTAPPSTADASEFDFSEPKIDLNIADPAEEREEMAPPKASPLSMAPPIVERTEVIQKDTSADLLGETRNFRRDEIGEEDAFATDMEEAEYFVQQGLLDEAKDVYRSILERQPNYSPAQEKLHELEGTVPVSPSPKSKAKPAKIEISPPAAKRPSASERVLREAEQSQQKAETADAGFFDLSNELQEEIQDLEQELSNPAAKEDEAFLSPEEVISEFKKGVARTVAKDDYQTHYNLGIAYKEMGLLDEAIHEFDIAAQDRSLSVDCASMIGLCLTGKREFDTAIEVYRRALGRVAPDSQEALGLSYELAEAYIGYGSLHEAYKLFARIRDVDPTFRDARRRAKELEADLGNSAPPVSAPEKKSANAVVDISKKKTKITYI